METFAEHVERLRQQRGFTQSRLISEATDYAKKGTSWDTVRNAVTGRRGSAWPAPVAIEAIARALGVAPDVFAVYRVQRARERLDPSVVGLASAVASADALLSQPIPEDVAEEAAQQREETPPSGAPSERQRTQRGRAA